MSVSWQICLNENGIYEWKLAFSIVLTICLKIMKFEHVLVYELLWKFHPGKSRQFPFIELIVAVFEYAIYGKEARKFAMLHINCKRFSAHDQ